MDARELRNQFQALPSPPDDGSFWSDRRAELRERIVTEGPDEFMTWPTIVSTMFVGDAPYIRIELDALRSGDWRSWQDAIAEDDAGHPARLPDLPWTSGNLIHQAYHLMCWERHTGKCIDSLKSIVEIGGGYGAMAKVARRAQFRGRYLIYDVPEFSLLQKYYLAACDIEAECRTKPDGVHSPDLLIALYSLIEMGDDERRAWLSVLRPKHCLVADNGERESARLIVALGKVERMEIEHMPGSYYLLR